MGIKLYPPVVVRIINSQNDLSDGRESALVLGGDVQDVCCQSLHLATHDDVAARRVHGEPLGGRLPWPRLLEHPFL